MRDCVGRWRSTQRVREGVSGHCVDSETAAPGRGERRRLSGGQGVVMEHSSPLTWNSSTLGCNYQPYIPLLG